MRSPDDLTLEDRAPGRASFLEDVLRGLSQAGKEISSKYFYDARGSELFERICETPEYYLTRAEIALLQRDAAEMGRCLGPRCLVVEPGAGAGIKTRLLLDSLEDPVGYVPIDISGEHLLAAARDLAAAHPGLEVLPVADDFTRDMRLPAPGRSPRRTVVYFPGSTIGNFERSGAVSLLAHLSRLAGPAGALLIGVDLKKDRARLEAAYDDAAGITAAFNLNVLRRANEELGADFDLRRFHHRAVYNEVAGRMEMYLVSEGVQSVRVGGRAFDFEEGEAILTELSHKYSPEEFADLLRTAGFHPERMWTDPDRLFSVHLAAVA